jgi:hypothetical protein
MTRGAVTSILAVTALLAACSREAEPPGGVTPDEAQQLNEAAAMLDANSVDAKALGNTAH